MNIKEHTLLFKAIVGSRAYGTNIEGSDTDIKGVFLQSPRSVYLDGYIPQIDVNDNETYFELGRFLELCQTGNPTMIELLWSPDGCIQHTTWAFEDIRQIREKFLSKSCRHSFAGYAHSQIKKAGGLDKKMNWEKERTIRKDVLDFCYVAIGQLGCVELKTWLKSKGWKREHCGLSKIDHMRNCYNLYVDSYEAWQLSGIPKYKYRGIADEDSNELKTDQIARDTQPEALMYFNLEAYQEHCKDYREYQDWLNKRNTQRYVDVAGHGQQIDGKNLLHCVRLLDIALEIPKLKTINVLRPNAEYLIGIRKGEYDLQTILDQCNERMESLAEVYENSDLPKEVDKEFVKGLIREIKSKHYEKAIKETHVKEEFTSNT